MRKLFHFTLCPFSRKIRLALLEKKLDFELVAEPVWEQRQEFLQLNPEGKTPVLIELNGTVVPGHSVISEYLEEAYPETPLFPEEVSAKIEVRRLLAWFDEKMGRECTLPLVFEKHVKRHMQGNPGPNSGLIRSAKSSIIFHLDYISWLVDRRRWLAGESFSLVDLCAAAHLSSLDYLGDVPWEKFPSAKDWYARIKSRPSFRSLLSDRVPSLPPALHYVDLDF